MGSRQSFAFPPEYTILVSGATGFIGGGIASALAGSAAVVALCRDQVRAAEKFAPFSLSPKVVVWDMAEPLLYAGRVDAIIHAADPADPAVYVSNPATAMRDSVLGCVNLLDYAARRGIRRFVLVSTGEVYGLLPGDERIREDEHGQTESPGARSGYPVAKRTAENLVLAYGLQYGMSVSIARLCHVYGPGMDHGDSRIAVQFPLAAAGGRDIVLKSSGEQRRSLCYITDAARGVIAVLAWGADGEIYNVADEASETTVRGFAEKLLSLAGRGGRLAFQEPAVTERERFNPMHRARLSSAKLRALGWRPKTSLDEGIAAVLSDLEGKGGGDHHIEKCRPDSPR